MRCPKKTVSKSHTSASSLSLVQAQAQAQPELGRHKSEHALTDVALPNLLSDLDVRAIDSAYKEAAVEAELHVGCTRRLGASSGDVLADIRGRDEDLCEGDGVVGEEEELEVVLGVGVCVDDPSDVDDEANRQLGNVVCARRPLG